MTKPGPKPQWICDKGHPKYRVKRPGGQTPLVCHICAKVAKSASPRMCIRGHEFPVEERQCRLCLIYKQNPWLKELDENGKANCPRGHEMTHDTLNYDTPKRRCCSTCYLTSRQRAIQAMAKQNTGKSNANKGKTYGVKKTFADWVVVLRLIEGRLDEVYSMKRGFTVGPTPMEEWIAHNSMNPMESAHRLAYSEQKELCTKRGPQTDKVKANSLASSFIIRWEKWGTYGRARKWEPKTMWELIGEE